MTNNELATRVTAIAIDHSDACARNAIMAANENAAIDGIELADAEAIDQALEMIDIICHCDR